MRGKGYIMDTDANENGITPAYAGKSLPAMLTTSGDRDHPRVCGEKPCTPPLTRWGRGSPPRMRGKVFRSVRPSNTQ